MPSRENHPMCQSDLPCWTSKRIAAKRSGSYQYSDRHGDHHGRLVSTRPLSGGASRCSLASGADFHLLSLRNLQSIDDTLGTVDEGKVGNAGFVK